MQTEKLHQSGNVHGNICPDNIIVKSSGTCLSGPVFGKFGTAVMNTELPDCMHGYAAEERYRPDGIISSRTDVYSICAIIYRCVTGAAPAKATERLADEKLLPISDYCKDIDPMIASALMQGLRVNQNKRFRNINILLTALNIKSENIPHVQPVPENKPEPVTPGMNIPGTNNIKTEPVNIVPPVQKEVPETPEKKKNSSKPVLIILICVLVLALVGGGVYFAYTKGLFGKDKDSTSVSDEADKHDDEKEKTDEDNDNNTVEDIEQTTEEQRNTVIDDSDASVYIEEATTPGTLKKGEGFKIRGIIKVNDVKLSKVYGCIETTDGKTVQESTHEITEIPHDLKKSVNKDLLFGKLEPGDYVYKVIVFADDEQSKTTVIRWAFSVAEE